ncbi:MAG TPA: alpha-amylase family glycosyl hydrolase, partial [Spirochaetota bacterium]|nr:alpha-amylase family glycosyl hydrolase [Spirochaetota bacterium]
GERSAAKVENLNNYFEYVENTLPKGAVNAPFLTNHDEVASRPFTDYGGNIDKCILAAGLAILAHGSPFIYNGNELGMADGKAKGDMKHRTRIELEKIESLLADKDSILNWHKYFIKLKKSYSALRTGGYKRVPSDDGKTLAFLRYNDSETMLIVAGFNKETKSVSLDFSGIDVPKGEVTLLLGKTAGKNLSLTDENISKFTVGDIEPASMQVYIFGVGERIR